MDLLQLKYFKVVAEQEHITKSAKLLMVSQPYLSAIVARLEDEMGGKLFNRYGRRVVLNEYGKILLYHVNEALQHLEDGKKEIADMRSKDTKYIRLASSSTMLAKVWLVKFLKEYGDIRLAHFLAAPNEITDGLLRGSFDFGLTTNKLDHPKIVSIPLWQDRYTVLMGADHPMAVCKKIYLKEIESEKICALPEDQSKLRIVDELCRKASFEPNLVLEGNVEILSDYLREGLAVSFGLTSIKDSYRDICSIPLADEVGEVSVYLSWCGERYLTNSMLTLQRYLTEVGKKIKMRL